MVILAVSIAVSMISAVPVVSFRWFRFGVSGFNTYRNSHGGMNKSLSLSRNKKIKSKLFNEKLGMLSCTSEKPV